MEFVYGPDAAPRPLPLSYLLIEFPFYEHNDNTNQVEEHVAKVLEERVRALTR